jgi:dihydropteroate synthase
MLLFFDIIAKARSLGINDFYRSWFWFRKTLDQNYEVLKHLELFQMLDLPILAGISRKSMIYKVLDSSAKGHLMELLFSMLLLCPKELLF